MIDETQPILRYQWKVEMILKQSRSHQAFIQPLVKAMSRERVLAGRCGCEFCRMLQQE